MKSCSPAEGRDMVTTTRSPRVRGKLKRTSAEKMNVAGVAKKSPAKSRTIKKVSRTPPSLSEFLFVCWRMSLSRKR